MPGSCNVLMIYPRFGAGTFWNFAATCELMGAKYPTAPLGLITVAALLPETWTVRLVDRNIEELATADLAWADLVMSGGMLPQHNDMVACHRSLPGERQTGRHRRAGCDLGAARLSRGGFPSARRSRRHH